MTESGPPCSEELLREAASTLGCSMPVPLQALYRAGDGRFDPTGSWWVIWPLERTVTESGDAWRGGSLNADLLAFGDDGTGNPFCLPVDGRDEVVRWSWIDGAVERSEGSFAEFVGRWAPDQGARP